MSEIDIDALSEDELYALGGRIYDRITVLERKRERAALSRYRSGLRIIVAAPGYGHMTGTIIRPNQKTITVRMENEQIWRVSPHYILATEDDVKALVSEEMSFLSMSEETVKSGLSRVKSTASRSSGNCMHGRKAITSHSGQKRAGEGFALWPEPLAVSLPVPAGRSCGYGQQCCGASLEAHWCWTPELVIRGR